MRASPTRGRPLHVQHLLHGERTDEAASFVGERPKLETLYDVFVNVRNDEREHWKTLCNLVQFDDMQGAGGKVLSTKAAPSELGAA